MIDLIKKLCIKLVNKNFIIAFFSLLKLGLKVFTSAVTRQSQAYITVTHNNLKLS